jgi:GxxExxY protein
MANASDPTQSAQSARRLNSISQAIIGAAVEVHRHLGPGLLESIYEACLVKELIEAGFAVERQKALPLAYKGQRLDVGLRLDLIVEGLVIVELKSNVPKLVEGVRRVANAVPEE